MVLLKWLMVPKLFFLVLGRGSFLNYVSCRPGNPEMPTASRFDFRALEPSIFATQVDQTKKFRTRILVEKRLLNTTI